MSQTPILTEIRGDALVVTLNRPEVRNAIEPALAAELALELARLDAEETLKSCVITGRGGNFCAGMDLQAFSGATPAEAAETLDKLVRFATRKPVIAAIEGYAVGGGLELALNCDLIVAAADAQMGLPEVRWGLVPSGGGLLRLPTRLPVAVAMDMALSGELVDGARLHGCGLVSRLAPPGEALDAALELAASIAGNGPRAVISGKELVRASLEGDEDALWARQEEICGEINASAEAREGIEAFLQRRPPRFGTDGG